MDKRPATNIDEYLAIVPEPARTTLEKMRAAIQAAAPDAIEAISYGMPAFKYRGRGLVAIAASKKHCSLFPMSGAVIEKFKGELAACILQRERCSFRSINLSLPRL